MSNTKINCTVCNGKYLYKNRKRHYTTRKHLRSIAPPAQPEEEKQPEVPQKIKDMIQHIKANLYTDEIKTMFELMKLDITPTPEEQPPPYVNV